MCHQGSSPVANLNLKGLKGVSAVAANPKQWEKIILNVRSHVMPPPGAAHPSLAQRETIVSWIQRALSEGCELDSPGRITIRRLNRAEYNNTVRDLLYVNIRPADDFPSDDVGYGFDNIGDVLSLTPLHLERYMKAARTLAHEAIKLSQPKARVADFSKLTPGQGWNFGNEGEVGMYSNARIEVMFNVEADGFYTLKVSAGAQQAGPELARLAIAINDVRQPVIDVAAPRQRPTEYKLPIEAKQGKLKVALAFINDYYEPTHPDPTKRDRNLYIFSAELSGPENAAGPSTESHRRLVFARPGPGMDENQAARLVLNRFASRAYRRPATLQEVDRLLSIFKEVRKNGDSYDEAIQVCIQAVLVNPHFLFRVELDSGAKPGERVLNNYELASRLSYFLWSSMPDEQLTAAATSGKLIQDSVLDQQITRMLADPKAQALADQFATQWLQITRIVESAPDPELFPGFSEELRRDLVEECKRFFMDAVNADRPYTEFISSKHTFLNARLARHYGVPGAFDDRFQRVDVSQFNRGGLLGMGAVMTVTSNPNRTSPVKRGKWVMEQLLSTPTPPPPPDVGVIEDDSKPISAKTIRERLVQHRDNPSCASCHRPLDAMGFMLENYDAVGRWRDKDGQHPVDNLGDMPDGKKLYGVNDLKSYLLSRKKDLGRALAEKLLTYALGRGLTASDACLIDEMIKKVDAKGGSTQTLIREIIKSEAFRSRSVQPVGR